MRIFIKNRIIVLALIFISFFVGKVFAYYNPQQGRWITRDPIEEVGHATKANTIEQASSGQNFKRNLVDRIFPHSFTNSDINFYSFTKNEPINLIDPLGLITVGFTGVGPQGEKYANYVFKQGVEARGGKIYDRSGPGLRQARKDIQEIKEDPCNEEEVNIYGYSRGAYVALILASELNKLDINVDLLFTIDPVVLWPVDSFKYLKVPSNVVRAENHFQQGKKLGLFDFAGRPLNGNNVNNEQYYDDEGIFYRGVKARHENMPYIVFGP